ncbi:hypothetical protein LUZ60_016941 [Juncus effusus]|nr:hypothetical protein LUZ60_016941 [Juncus effusus]
MSSSSSNSNQPTWVPYVPTKDCSQGFCSIYCPQWCYFLFPPPPPISSSAMNSDSSSGPIFSPLVIAIIGILASAFLLITYYTIVSKYCTTFDQIHRRRVRNGSSSENQTANNGSDHPTAWHTLPSDGLEDSVIRKIAVWKYKKGGDGDLEVTHGDCSVCLNEFLEGEDLRLLPKCMHAFHVQCIDTWLKSHSNCPLCRASIIPVQHEEVKDTEMVITINDYTENNIDTDVNTDTTNGGNEEEIIEVSDRELEMDSNHASGARVSIADVLQLSMEEELMLAKEHGLLVTSAGSSRGKEKVRALHSVMSGPVPMKRSLSSGRMLRNVRGRERDDVIPMWDNSNSNSSR